MNMSSSFMGPAVMPSGGSEERARYSLKRRFAAVEAMVAEWMERERGGEWSGVGGLR